MRNIFPIMIAIAITGSGCVNEDFEELERRTEIEQLAATQPTIREPFDVGRCLENTGRFTAAVVLFVGLSWLDEWVEKTFCDSDATVAGYSPTADRKQVRGH